MLFHNASTVTIHLRTFVGHMETTVPVSSSKEGGTFYQLCNLINRRNVVKKPKKDVAACEDFFELVVEAHIVTAAMKAFNMSSVNVTPSSQHFPGGSPGLPKQQRIKLVLLAMRNLGNELVDVSFPSASGRDESCPCVCKRVDLTWSLICRI